MAFDPGSSGFDLGTVEKPKHDPGTFTQADKEAMVKGLAAVGLKCPDNTVEKMDQYIKTVSSYIKASATGKTTYIAEAKSGADDFVYKIDGRNQVYSKMMTIVKHLEEIEKDKLYVVNKHSVKTSFKSTTTDAILEAMKEIGRQIDAVAPGNIDPGQVMSYMGKFIASLATKSEKDLSEGDQKSWFGFVPQSPGSTKYPAVIGVHFEYKFEVDNYKNKKKEHRTSYEVTQRNIEFTDLTIMDEIYGKVSKS